MPIYGLTHRKDGQLIQQFAVDLKVSIGKPPDENKNYPTKLDHFFFTTKNSKGEWTEDKKLTEKLQQKYSSKIIKEDHKEYFTPVREFDIFFLSDDTEEIFRTNYEWWTKSECRCRGNGLEAERSVMALTPQQITDMKVDPRKVRRVPWKPCGQPDKDSPGCPELAQKLCKAHGTLHFTLIDRPNIGSVAVYYTTSPKTIRQIGSALDQIKTLTGGRLKGIKFRLRLKPGKSRHPDPKNSEKMIVSTAYFVHIEFQEDDFKGFFQRLMLESVKYEQSRILQATQAKALPPGTIFDSPPIAEVVPLSEAEQAAIIGPEFHPTGEEPEELDTEEEQLTQPAAISEAAEKAATFEKEFEEYADRLQLNKAKKDFILSRFAGDYESSRNFLGRFLKFVVDLGLSIAEADEYLKRGIVNEPWLWETLDAALQKFREAKANAANAAATAGAKAKSRKKETQTQASAPAAPAVTTPPLPPPDQAPVQTVSPEEESSMREPGEDDDDQNWSGF